MTDMKPITTRAKRGNRVRKLAVALALTASLPLALASCEDPHKGEHCVAHTTILMPIYHPGPMIGNVQGAGYTTYIYESQCSQWAPNHPASGGSK